jgi:hypothetical protein
MSDHGSGRATSSLLYVLGVALSGWLAFYGLRLRCGRCHDAANEGAAAITGTDHVHHCHVRLSGRRHDDRAAQHVEAHSASGDFLGTFLTSSA